MIDSFSLVPGARITRNMQISISPTRPNTFFVFIVNTTYVFVGGENEQTTIGGGQMFIYVYAYTTVIALIAFTFPAYCAFRK
jgi:hypothetical protein